MVNLYAVSRNFSLVAMVLLLSCLTESGAANASSPSDLYSAKVELTDNSSKARRVAFGQAMGKVLIKLSGSREILEAPQIVSIMNRAPRFVQSYNKEKLNLEPSGTEPSVGTEKPLVGLHVEFDGPALERALITAGLPVWSGMRPTTIVWLAVEEGRQRYILAEKSNAVLLSSIQQTAEERGLPVVIPLMDKTDRRQVEFIDVRGGFVERLEQASERYSTAIMLVGTLQSFGKNAWSVKWTVLGENMNSSWTESGLPLQQALQSGIHGLTDLLATHYAFIAAPDGQLSKYLLSINNVVTLESYAAILALLQDLVFVENVTPVQIMGSQVQYRLLMNASTRGLERALASSGKFKALDRMSETPAIIDSGDPLAQKPVELKFNWQP